MCTDAWLSTSFLQFICISTCSNLFISICFKPLSKFTCISDKNINKQVFLSEKSALYYKIALYEISFGTASLIGLINGWIFHLANQQVVFILELPLFQEEENVEIWYGSRNAYLRWDLMPLTIYILFDWYCFEYCVKFWK